MELYKTFDLIRKSNLQARRDNNYFKLLENGQALLDYVPDLIEIMVNSEHAYRKLEAKLSQEKDELGKRNTSAWCETQAKASEDYREYIKAEATLKWVYDSVNLSKKLAQDNENELKSTIKKKKKKI